MSLESKIFAEIAQFHLADEGLERQLSQGSARSHQPILQRNIFVPGHFPSLKKNK